MPYTADDAAIDLAKTPSFRLDGKRALVTGGGRGIGLAAASALAAAGAHVTLAARTKAEIEDAAAAIRARGEKADALVLDVTDVEAAKKALAAVAPYQILINNAGGNRPPICPTSRSRTSTSSSRSTCAPPSSWRRPWRCG